MKIIINATQYKKNSSGIGVLSKWLFSCFTKISNHECTVILLEDSPQFQSKPGTKQIRLPYKKGQNIRRILFLLFKMGHKFCKNSVFLTTDSKIPILLPNSCKIIPIITDLAIYKLRGAYQFSRVILWKLQYFFLKKRSNKFIAISECTKRDLIEVMQIEEEKIDIVYCAADPAVTRNYDESIRNKYGLPNNYILYVGNLNPRKNLHRLILAFDKLKKETDLPHKLVIVGDIGWKFNFQKIMHSLESKNDILLKGFISDTEISSVYSMADVFAFPSLYEGFGIPILEAQQCGTPVLTSNCSAMPEVGGKGAHYVDPYDINEIYGGLKKILMDCEYADYLVQEGYKNAMKFSWEKSAEKLSKIVESVIEK